MLIHLRKRVAILDQLIESKLTFLGLPLLLIGVVLAMKGYVMSHPFQVLLLSFCAFASGRCAGMSFNKLFDAKIDAKNPRTANRIVAAGGVRKHSVAFVAWGALGVFFLSCYLTNPLCFYLSLPAALTIFLYSFLKRFTAFCHFGLGLVHLFIPLCSWAAVRGDLSISALFLALAAGLRIAGADMLYAFLDYDFDRKNGIYSFPAKYGKRVALAVSLLSFVLTILFLFLLGRSVGLNELYQIGVFLLFPVLMILWWKAYRGEGIMKAFVFSQMLFPVLLLLLVLVGML